MKPIEEALKEINSTLRDIARRMRQLESVEHPGVVCRWRGLTAGAPAAPLEGDIYHDTLTHQAYIRANGGWAQIS